MSRVAKSPIIIPTDVEVKLHDQNIYIQGPGGKLTQTIHGSVRVKYTQNKLTIIARQGFANGWTLAGTMRALLNNMVIGVTRGFTKKLQLVGIGYRIVIEGNRVNLFLGFSHTIDHQLPIGVTAECPSQTEIILRSADKQLVGQVAADLRSYRRPDSYKGKGIRYANEAIYIKETKKK